MLHKAGSLLYLLFLFECLSTVLPKLGDDKEEVHTVFIIVPQAFACYHLPISHWPFMLHPISIVHIMMCMNYFYSIAHRCLVSFQIF